MLLTENDAATVPRRSTADARNLTADPLTLDRRPMTPDIRRLEPHDQTPPGYVRFAYYVTYQPPTGQVQKPAVLHVAAIPASFDAGGRTDAAEAFLAYERRHRPNNAFVFSSWLESPGDLPATSVPYPKPTSERLGVLYNFLNSLAQGTDYPPELLRTAAAEHATLIGSVVPHYLALVRFSKAVKKAQLDSKL